jgi:hypothetical protein
MPETQYLVHNTTRGVETRFQRRTAPEPPRMTLMLGGGSVRVLRNRPQAVTESMLRRLLPELLKLETAGRLKVTTLAGLRVDVSTFKVLEAPAVSPPLPKPPLDSADRDKNANVGDVVLKHGDPKFIPQNVPLPLPAAARGLVGGPVEDELPPPSEDALPDVELEATPSFLEPEPVPEEPSTSFAAAPPEPETAAAVPEAKSSHRESKRDRRR